ncbi:MAG TPA: amino acid permease [Myxococcota bacterium]|nr:amino acid permease [Myxococcota bacterium]
MSTTKQLDRSLGFPSVYSIAVGAMLGSGIFVLPGLAAAIAGPWVALSYMLAGVLVLPAVLSKAELATAMPVAGGTYVYIDRSMGPWMGTVTGLGTWLSLSSKSAFALVGLGSYLVLFTDLPVTWVSLAILGVLLLVNVLGAGKATLIQILIVSVTIVALTVLGIGGGLKANLALLEPAFPAGSAGIVAGAGFVFVSYSGVTKICSVAEEVRNPDRNIPLGMLAAQFTVMVIYAVIALALTSNIPVGQLEGTVTPVAALGGVVFGEVGLVGFAIIAIAGLVSMCNAGVLSTTRFPFAMARDRLLPDVLKTVNARFRTPTAAIAVTGVLLVAMVTFLPVVTLAKLASGFKIFVFCIVNLAVIVLRESGARWYKPTFKTPLYPWIQILGILGGIWLLTQLGTKVLYGVTAAMTIGTAWYFGYARRRVDRKGAVKHIWGEAHALQATQRAEEEEEEEDKPPRVIVPVFGYEPAPGHLLRLAAGFVEEGVLEVVRFEEIPHALPLIAHLDPDAEMERLKRQTEVIAEDLHVLVDFHDVVTHNAMEALLKHARATEAEWIVMEPARGELRRLVRYPMAWWLDNVPCDIAIYTDKGFSETSLNTSWDELDSPTEEVRSQPFARILVLAEPGPHDSIVVRMADELARKARGEITLFYAAGPGDSNERIQSLRDYHSQLKLLCTRPARSLIPRTDHVALTIREITCDYDLMVVGAPSERTLRTLFFGSKEHRVVEAAQCSVLKIKAPRHQVHHRLGALEDRYDLGPVLEAGVVKTGLRVGRKEELFARMAHHLAKHAGVEEDRVETALWRRERRQNTALRSGIALSAPTTAALTETLVGVFTLARPVRFGAPTNIPVDVCVVSIGPTQDRRRQLRLLAQLSERIVGTDVIDALRSAEDAASVIASITADP